MRKNILYHITYTNFLFESRVQKEIESISNNNLFNNIYILAIHKKGLKSMERFGTNSILIRLSLSTKNLFFLKKIKLIIYAELFLKIFFVIKKNKKNKLITSIHVIDLLPISFLIKLFFNSIIIYDAHELETHTNSKKISIFIKTIIEKIFVPSVSLIIVVNNSIKKIYQIKFPSKKIISVYNSPKYNSHVISNYLRENLQIKNESKIYLYQGGFEKGRGIEILLDIFSKFTSDERVIVFLGFGSLDSIITEYSKLHDNIFILTAVPPNQLLNITSSCDYGISLIENSCKSYYYCLPNKVLEFLMCRKPVLVSNLPEMSDLINRYKVGIVSNNYSFNEIYKSFLQIESFDYTKFVSNIDKMIYKFSWDSQENVLIDSYKELIK